MADMDIYCSFLPNLSKSQKNHLDLLRNLAKKCHLCIIKIQILLYHKRIIK